MPDTMRCQPLLGVAFATDRTIKEKNKIKKKKEDYSALKTALSYSSFKSTHVNSISSSYSGALQLSEFAVSGLQHMLTLNSNSLLALNTQQQGLRRQVNCIQWSLTTTRLNCPTSCSHRALGGGHMPPAVWKDPHAEKSLCLGPDCSCCWPQVSTEKQY